MDTAPSSVQVREDLIYAIHDGVELRGDLYLPAGSGPFPVVVGATGGGFVRCGRGDFAGWGAHLARNGIGLFSIDYRTGANGKMFPEAPCDVIAAVQFVRGDAAALGVDPDRVALLGSSAGANMAALAALAWEAPLFKGRYPNDDHAGQPGDVRALVGIYGVYDFVAAWLSQAQRLPNVAGSNLETYLGCSLFEDRQRYFDASPISYLGVPTQKPAVFLAYGTEDHAVDTATQSVPFQQQLIMAGYQVRPCVVPGAPHFWFSDEPIDEPWSFPHFVAPRLVKFLKRTF